MKSSSSGTIRENFSTSSTSAIKHYSTSNIDIEHCWYQEFLTSNIFRHPNMSQPPKPDITIPHTHISCKKEPTAIRRTSAWLDRSTCFISGIKHQAIVESSMFNIRQETVLTASTFVIKHFLTSMFYIEHS